MNSTFLSNIQGLLGLVPVIGQAVTAFKAIGHSQATAITKINEIVQVSAAVGELIPIPQVQAISAIVESIAQQVYATSAPAAPATA